MKLIPLGDEAIPTAIEVEGVVTLPRDPRADVVQVAVDLDRFDVAQAHAALSQLLPLVDEVLPVVVLVEGLAALPLVPRPDVSGLREGRAGREEEQAKGERRATRAARRPLPRRPLVDVCIMKIPFRSRYLNSTVLVQIAETERMSALSCLTSCGEHRFPQLLYACPFYHCYG